MYGFLKFLDKLRVRSRAAGWHLAIHINCTADPAILAVGTAAAANHLSTLTLVVLTGVVGHG